MLFPVAPTLSVEAGSLTALGAHWFRETGWPMTCRICLSLPQHCNLSIGITDVHGHTQIFFMESWDLNSGLHALAAITAQTEPPPQPQEAVFETQKM